MDIIKKANSLKKSFIGLDLNQIYQKFIDDKLLNLVIKRMSPIEIVKLIFLIDAINKKISLSDTLDKINTKLFAFSLILFDDSDPSVQCSNCSGDGWESCNYCDGDGEVTCDSCDGNGEIEGDDDIMLPCEECQGGGKVRCDRCYDGTVNCYYCDGDGELIQVEDTNFKIVQYLSIDESIFSLIFVADISKNPISEDLFHKVNNKCLRITSDYFESGSNSETSEIDSKFRGEIHINNLSQILDFDLNFYRTLQIEDGSEVNDRFLKKSNN